MKTSKLFKISTLTAAILSSSSAFADQVIQDDLVVTSSACIGFDCVNGESFGSDTIRLKENNLRIKAQDTSNSASFPSNDWQITFNDSTNGGMNKFSIDDIDGGRTPFTIEAGAPSHSLYVDDGGRLGLGTSTPVVELHVVNGDSPTLRLEQDGSSGFTPQTWDLASNETNFFIRDATNGSRLPFRIRPSAPSNSLYIDTDGDIGLGDASPDAALDIESGDLLITRGNLTVRNESPSILIENTSATVGDKNLLNLKNNGDVQVVLSNTSSGLDWKISHSNDTFYIVNPSGSGQELTLDVNGNLTTSGTVNGASSRKLKENILNADLNDVLHKLSQLDIFTWNYIKDGKDIVHLGPIAEEFHSLFKLNGSSNEVISYTDITGVSLAAIKALMRKLDLRDKEISEVKARLAELENQ